MSDQGVPFSLIVAVKDEKENMAPLVAEIALAVSSRDPSAYEAIFIDDGSSDGTQEELVRLKSVLPGLRVLAHGRNLGKSMALRTGIRAARFPIVVTMDGDGQNDPADVHLMLAPFKDAGAELGLVAGQRISPPGHLLQALGVQDRQSGAALAAQRRHARLGLRLGRRCRASCSSACPISTTCTAS